MKRTRASASYGELFDLPVTAAEAEEPVADHIYAVSELTSEIKALLETAHPAVYVRGEISGFRLIGASGHMYFDLKDENEAECSCGWLGIVDDLVPPQDTMVS